jgi:hypothetical protein
MNLVNNFQEFISNNLFSVHLTLDTSLLSSQLPKEVEFLISARDAEIALIKANRWLVEIANIAEPQSIGDLIMMNMDFNKFLFNRFKSQNVLLSAVNENTILVESTVSAPKSYSEAYKLAREHNVYKNFTLSIFDDIENFQKSA